MAQNLDCPMGYPIGSNIVLGYRIAPPARVSLYGWGCYRGSRCSWPRQQVPGFVSGFLTRYLRTVRLGSGLFWNAPPHPRRCRKALANNGRLPEEQGRARERNVGERTRENSAVKKALLFSSSGAPPPPPPPPPPPSPPTVLFMPHGVRPPGRALEESSLCSLCFGHLLCGVLRARILWALNQCFLVLVTSGRCVNMCNTSF